MVNFCQLISAFNTQFSIQNLIIFLQNIQPQLQGAASQQTRSLTLLLELLTVIPEEFQTLILSSSRRSAVRHTFAQGLGQVLPFLLNVISHHSQQQDGNTEAVLQVKRTRICQTVMLVIPVN